MKKSSIPKPLAMGVRGWTPVLTRTTFCSPACGFGCTIEAWGLAKKRARELAAKLGPGWKHEIWENRGWHYKAISPCGRVTVHGNHYVRGVNYTAFLGLPGQNGDYAEHGHTPQAAVRKVLASAKSKLAILQTLTEPVQMNK